MPCPKRLLVVDPRLPAPGAGPRPVPAGPDLTALFQPLEALGVEVVRTTEADASTLLRDASGQDVLALPPAAAEARARRSNFVRSKGPGPRQVPDGPPVLIVADPDDPIAAVVAGRALRDSALWDIVSADAPPEEVLLRTERLVAQAQINSDLELARYQASHDDRTGLLRPAPFDERMREHFSAAQRHRLELALIVIDLDRFGEVNKRYDHTVGDQLIARAGSVIRMSLREEDVGARLGGDEFAIVLPYTERVDAARVVTRLAGRFRALSGPPPASFKTASPTNKIRVSASIGFETFNGADLESPDELRGHAERALHEAKESGGDRGVYYRSLVESED
ncbi:MAG: GGDEF domain-containing protein [Planctomycetota bacterium]